MLGIQFSIGSLNDVVDAPRDAVAKPRKPIAAGIVDPRFASVLAGGGAAIGLALSAASGPSTLLVGACCLGLGWLYDLRLSRTVVSWLPLSLALPLLPIHAWLGAAGTVPGSLLTLVPIGVLAGAGLALANGLVDVDRDAATRRSAIVVRLGRRRAWLLQTVALGAAAASALILLPGSPADGGGLPGDAGPLVAAFGRPALLLGCACLALGAGVLISNRPGLRERGWELEAIGVVGLGIGWLAAVATRGGA